MSKTPSEVERFLQFLNERIAEGATDLSPEDAVAQWRASQRAIEEEIAAVKKSLADLDAGKVGRPFREFVEEFRAEHKIPRDV